MSLESPAGLRKAQLATRKRGPPSRLDSSLSRILSKRKFPDCVQVLSYVPRFPKRVGFPPSPFPPPPAYRSKLASAFPIVGFLASPTEAGEWIFPTQGRRLRVSARCFYPLGQFQFYSLRDLRQGKKMKDFVHILCARIVFLQRVGWARFPGGERTPYSQNFPHGLEVLSTSFPWKDFPNS